MRKSNAWLSCSWRSPMLILSGRLWVLVTGMHAWWAYIRAMTCVNSLNLSVGARCSYGGNLDLPLSFSFEVFQLPSPCAKTHSFAACSMLSAQFLFSPVMKLEWHGMLIPFLIFSIPRLISRQRATSLWRSTTRNSCLVWKKVCKMVNLTCQYFGHSSAHTFFTKISSLEAKALVKDTGYKNDLISW